MCFARAKMIQTVFLLLFMAAFRVDAGELAIAWGEEGVGYYNASVPGFAESFAEGPNAIAPGEAGQLLIADTQGDCVLVVDESGKILARHGAKDRAGLALVTAVARYGKGEILAGKMRSGDIVRIDAAGKQHAFYSSPPKGPRRIGQLQSLASDSSGRVFAGDVAGQRILVLSERGELLEEVEWGLTGFAVTSDGTLLRLKRRDGGNYALIARSAAGADSERFVLPAAGDGAILSSPRLLGVDASGNVFLRHADPKRPGVLMARRYSADGTTFQELGEVAACGGEDVFALTPQGRLFAMEYDAEKAPAGEVTVRELVAATK